MKKKLLAVVLTLVMVVSFMPTMAFAVSTVGSGTPPAATEVSTYQALKSELGKADVNEINIKLTGNIDSESSLSIAKDKTVTIDLNGYSITREKEFNESFYYNSENDVPTAPTLLVSGTLTVKDSGTESEKSGSINSKITLCNGINPNRYSAHNCAVWVAGGTFIMESGSINATTNGDEVIGVFMQNTGGTFEMRSGSINVGSETYLGNAYGVKAAGNNAKATFTMTGGTINAIAKVVLLDENGNMPIDATTGEQAKTGDACGVFVAGNGKTDANCVFSMTNGTIISKGFGISGNDDYNGTDIDIKGSKIEGYTAAIFHPQKGTLDIEDSTLTGTTGLEAKGGTINIKGGTFNSLLKEGDGGRIYCECTTGNSTKGWAVAVVNNARYKTNGVELTIDGGVYNAPVSVLDDDQADTERTHSYNITINDGTFNSHVRMYGYDAVHYTTMSSDVAPAAPDSIVINGGTFRYNPVYHITAEDKTAVKMDSAAQKGAYKVISTDTITEVEEKAATCSEAGNDKYYKYTSALGTTPVACYSYNVNYDGYEYKWSTASVEKDYYAYYTNTNYIRSKLEHVWDKTTETAATEEATGSISYKCKNCSATKTDTIEKKGVHHDKSDNSTLISHVEVKADCANQANGTKAYWTCTNEECKDKIFVKDEDGKFVETTKDALVIKWEHRLKTIKGKAATCTEAGTTDGQECETCKQIITPQAELPKLGHTPQAAETETVAATCTKDGSSSEIIKCKTCSVELSKTTITIPAAHKWNEGVVTKQPTTTSTGVKTYTCTVCDETKTEEIAKLPRPSSGGGGGSAVTTTYDISVPSSIAHGSVSLSKTSAAANDKVTLTVKADKGYTLEVLKAKDANGKEVELTAVKLGEEYTFVMPASKVSFEVSFMEDNSMLNYFADVNVADYFYDAVLWAAEKGITTGVDDSHFAPKTECTRAQIVTFLWRAAGSPEVTTEKAFSDVAADGYYAKAVAWAVANGITTGTEADKFSPNDTCTRAQSVTFLARALKGTAETSAEFTDVASDSYYASAVSWAKANGITTGVTETAFGPDNDCTRAQIVTFLYRAYANK